MSDQASFTSADYIMTYAATTFTARADSVSSFGTYDTSMYGFPEPSAGWVPAPYTPPQPYVWPPGTTVSPSIIIDELEKRQAEEEEPETLEDTIFATQDQALYDVQNGNITEEQFFEVMKMTFAMLKLLPKKEEPDGQDEEEDR